MDCEGSRMTSAMEHSLLLQMTAWLQQSHGKCQVLNRISIYGATPDKLSGPTMKARGGEDLRVQQMNKKAT